MLERIKKYVEEQNMLKKEDCVIAGVSGGADSVCLLFVLLELQKSIGFQLVAVHVNHELRGEDADADEAFVKNLCCEKNIKCICYSENVESLAKKWKQSTEEAGRSLRRTCFEEVMKTCGGTKIALAHHKNDSAETFLMNLARGTGLKGLGGIAPVQGKFIRPLLCVERKEIEKYLHEKGIPYCTDATNASDDYTRNRVRNHILPYMVAEVNEKTVAHMGETMAYLREVQKFLENQRDSYWEKCVLEGDNRYLLLKEEFEKVPDVIRPMILKKVLSETANREKDIENIHLRSLEELLEKQTGRKMDLPYGIEARKTYQGLEISVKKDLDDGNKEEVFFVPDKEEYTFGEYQISCHLQERNEIEKYMEKGGTNWIDYDIIQNGVSFRTRRPGDYITIDKEGRTQKLKSYFINEKIPQGERDDILLVADGSHIIWIWGYRRNCAYQMTDSTKHVLEININKGEKTWQKKSKY